MQQTHHDQRKLYVGMHDGVCALTSTDAGKRWQQGQVTLLAHAAARLSGSPTVFINGKPAATQQSQCTCCVVPGRAVPSVMHSGQ